MTILNGFFSVVFDLVDVLAAAEPFSLLALAITFGLIILALLVFGVVITDAVALSCTAKFPVAAANFLTVAILRQQLTLTLDDACKNGNHGIKRQIPECEDCFEFGIVIYDYGSWIGGSVSRQLELCRHIQ